MKRCVECGRPFRGGLSAPALLELALDELGEDGLTDENIQNLMRVRSLLRRVGNKVDAAVSQAADALAAGGG